MWRTGEERLPPDMAVRKVGNGDARLQIFPDIAAKVVTFECV
jgi:hypothetical protein